MAYVELHARSAFSFLHGASLPEEMYAEAARHELAGGALLERNGLYSAVRAHLAAAEQELADAQCNLGLCYQTGRGVEQDSAAAVRWFIKAARQGNKTAQHNLGVHYSQTEPEEGAEVPLAEGEEGVEDAAGTEGTEKKAS